MQPVPSVVSTELDTAQRRYQASSRPESRTPTACRWRHPLSAARRAEMPSGAPASRGRHPPGPDVGRVTASGS